MLASTVQFSNNNPQTNQHHHTPQTQSEAVWRQAGPEKETNNRKQPSQVTPLCPSSQDPTAYLQFLTHQQPVPTHPNKGMDNNNPKKGAAAIASY